MYLSGLKENEMKMSPMIAPGDTNRLKLVSCAKKYKIEQKTDFGDLKVLSVTTKTHRTLLTLDIIKIE